MQPTLPLEQRDGGRATYVLTVPKVPPSKNQLARWQPVWRSSLKKQWKRWIRRLCDEQQLPRFQHRVGLAARLVFPTNNRRDPQNYAEFLWDVIPDALQADGKAHLYDARWEPVLLDDRDGAISYGPNLGIQLGVDTRAHLPVKDRQRTLIAVSFTLEPEPTCCAACGSRRIILVSPAEGYRCLACADSGEAEGVDSSP